MRRAISAVLVTAAVVVLVASFRTHGARLTAIRPVARHAAAAPSPTATATATATTTTHSVAGDVIPTQFGNIQVSVRMRGSRILDVRALQLPFDHPRSQFISEQAEPILRQEVLQVQSARIDLLSGATYTSEAYAQSLQSALDRAR
jgi:uncharacterized protein with FMN-binding domain